MFSIGHAGKKTVNQFAYAGIFLLAASISAITTSTVYSKKVAPQTNIGRPTTDAVLRVSQNPIKPYTAVYEERITNPTTAVSFISVKIVEGVRQDGAKVTRAAFQDANKPLYTERKIYLPVDIVITITEEAKAFVAQHSAKWNPQSTRRADPQTDCQRDFAGQQLYDVSGPEDMLLGFRAIQLRQHNSKSTSTWTQWLLPQMSCINAKTFVSFRDDSGKVTDTTERIMTSLKAESPPSDLFHVPREYDQLSPSESFQRRAQLMKASPALSELAAQRNLDLYYYSHRVDVSTLP